MAFVKKEIFIGSRIAKMVDEELSFVGLTQAFNNLTYEVSIEGICDTDEDGNINDMPSMHTINISRSKFIGAMGLRQYNKFINNAAEKEELVKQKEMSISFGSVGENFENEQYFNIDTNGYVWFNHRVKFDVNRTAAESESGYITRIKDTILNYLIDTLENNMSQGDK